MAMESTLFSYILNHFKTCCIMLNLHEAGRSEDRSDMIGWLMLKLLAENPLVPYLGLTWR